MGIVAFFAEVTSHQRSVLFARALMTGLCALALLALPARAWSQSLPELSRQARAQKKQSNCKVWNNDEVARALESDGALTSDGKPAIQGCETRAQAPATPPNGSTHGNARDDSSGMSGDGPAGSDSALGAPAAGLLLENETSGAATGVLEPEAAVVGQAGAEVRAVATRWRTLDLEGHPELTYGTLNPYQQNILKADYPIAGAWFLEVNALNTAVYKSRRNLDFSNVFADQIAAGTLNYVDHNSFYAENLVFGAEIRRHDDTFVPSPFRLRINGVADYKHNINAFNAGSDGNAHLFDAFADIRLADFGHDNFDLLFLRGGIQGFRSDFHGLVFNDVGLGGRLFGEAKKNRLRYDVAWFKLFRKNGVSGFIDFSQPSRQQVVIGRLTWEDFLVPGWNSEWSVHYNRDHRKLAGSSETADLDTVYLGAAFNGHVGRWIFNPAFYLVTGTAEHLDAGVLVENDVLGWMGLLDLRYPLDFWTFRLGYLYASGDANGSNSRDSGFDAISDGVVLFGGPLSYWVGENIKFGRGDFLRGNSLFPSLRGVNEPANHINPGLQAVNAGADFTVSPRVQLSGNVNYLRFVETGSYTNRVVIIDRNAGVEFNFFIRWKPFLRQLNENIVLDNGFAILHPLAGLEGAFQSDRTVFSTFTALRLIF